jgi:thiamine-phosphate pyrophosphorylase
MVEDDVRLLAIAGPPVVPASSLVESCCAAVAGGVTAVQLRHKEAPASVLLQLTEALLDALPVPVYVNDRADVAWIAGAAGVHVGTEDLSPPAIRTFAPRPFHIGISVGSHEEAARASAADVDYWSVGPVYPTSTKPDAGSAIGLEGFRSLAARAPARVPVIAIGGIHPDNAAEILLAGAAGIAVSSAIFAARDVRAVARALRQSVDEILGS